MLATNIDFHWGSLGGWWSLAAGVLALGILHGVKTGVDHCDSQSLNIYIFLSSIILVLTLGSLESGWLIPLGLVIADCSWGCLTGLWWLMPNEDRGLG